MELPRGADGGIAFDDELSEGVDGMSDEGTVTSTGGTQNTNTATQVSVILISAARAGMGKWAGSRSDGPAEVDGRMVFPSAAKAAAEGAKEAAWVPRTAEGWFELFGQHGRSELEVETAHAVYKQWVADRRSVDADFNSRREGASAARVEEFFACKRVNSRVDKRRTRERHPEEAARPRGGRGGGGVTDPRDRRGDGQGGGRQGRDRWAAGRGGGRGGGDRRDRGGGQERQAAVIGVGGQGPRRRR